MVFIILFLDKKVCDDLEVSSCTETDETVVNEDEDFHVSSPSSVSSDSSDEEENEVGGGGDGELTSASFIRGKFPLDTAGMYTFA